jgi:YebC/PmpR family DNA-binding regulatory protein
MSGHSKWDTIKHKKALNDAKKGKKFTKLAQLISVAARDGGGDTGMNPSLRLLVEKARAESMPVANIDRAIDRGVGKGSESLQFERASYEGFGPAGVQLIVDVLTENRNRSVAEIKNIFSDKGGHFGETGAVSWNFENKGMVTMVIGKKVKSSKFGAPDEVVLCDKDETMLTLMEVEGVLDIQDAEVQDNPGFEVICDVVNLGKVRDAILALGYIVDNAEIVKICKMTKEFTPEQLDSIEEFISALEDYDDVQNVWTDIG